MNLACVLVSAACALGALSACSVAVEPIGEPVPPPVGVVVPAAMGTLTVNWLVGGTTDPAACVQYGAMAMQIAVYDASGAEITRQTAACGSFTITVPLPEGTYSVDAIL